MKKYGITACICILVLITGITAWLHLSSREDIAPGTLLITVDGRSHTVALSDLNCGQVSGVRVNGKGESIPVDGLGIALKDLLSPSISGSFSKVTVVADDSYSATLTAEEVNEDSKAYLLLQEDGARLVVFGDENSKRSISGVVQIIVE